MIELIDTLWNVNFKSLTENVNLDKELIDTLWNVNVYLAGEAGTGKRINRYIMECKF